MIDYDFYLSFSAPKEAFPIFLNGIRNCKELILAKKIKREASGKGIVKFLLLVT